MAGLQLRWLFGHDVFISYSRADGLAFASSLAFKLGETKASAYADVFGSEPGAKTPADVLRALRGAKVLVVLCTPGALRSAAVLDEIRQFPAGRPVVPVCLGVQPAALAAWSDRLQGLAVSDEPTHALAQAGPSEALVRRVAEAAGRWRQAKRLRWTIGSTALVLMLLALATVAATINGQRLVAAATVARQEKDQLVLQQVQLQGEIASAAATLESTKQSLRETTELFQMAAKQAREASNAQVQEMMDAPLGGEIDKFAAVTCYGGGFARGPLMVPFQPKETRLARVSDSLIEQLGECIAGSVLAVELFSPDRGDDAPAALKAKHRQVVKDRLVSLGVRPDKITLLNEPPPAARIRCLYPCVVIVRRQAD